MNPHQAQARNDPSRKRGAYVVAQDRLHYLNKSGQWTFGIEGNDGWWPTLADAQAALQKCREATQ